MIPFAILCGKIIFEKKQLEIRILELSRDFFTIRLPKNYILEEGGPVAFVLNFYKRHSELYKELVIKKFEINPGMEFDFFREYKVDVFDDEFSEVSGTFSTEYLEYIDEKVSGAIDEANSTDNYWDSYELQLRSKLLDFYKKIIGKKIYISLNNDNMIKQYLSNTASNFTNDYLVGNYCNEDILSGISVKGIAIGNGFCKHLLPTDEDILKLIKKTNQDGLDMVFIMPKCQEEDLELFIKNIELLTKHNVKIIINDLGLYEKMKVKQNNIFSGPLLNKKCKDPRGKLENGPDTAGEQDEFLFAPFYQTNTSAHCVLRGAFLHQDRGLDGNEATCEKYCLNKHFMYPKETGIFHRFNSLFGFLDEFHIDDENLILELE